MIKITRLNNKEVVINDSLVECLEANPDTTITMANGRKYIAIESVDEIIDKIIEYNRNIFLDRTKG